MAQLTVENLTKKYGDTTVVRDVSLAIPDGEFLVLLGPSGCGKTTTLRMIAGFIPPSAGAIRLGARDITHSHRGIAMRDWCFKATRYSRT